MSSHFNEASLEGHLLDQLRDLGWAILHGPDAAPGEKNAERTDYRDVVLVGRLHEAVVRLNPHLPPEAVAEAIRLALRSESPSLPGENWRAYRLLVEGVPVEYRDAQGHVKNSRARLIDFDETHNNDFVAANQFTIVGKRERRPDVLLFVNGLPLAFIELKHPAHQGATLRSAFNQIQTYRAQIPDVFTWNQITVIADGVQARAGSYSASWEHFAPWKTVHGHVLAPGSLPQIEVLLRGMFEKEVLLDLIRNFISFSDELRGPSKKVAKYHQYWAVRRAVEMTVDAVHGDGRAGVVWHTQGSGKSLEMLFYAGKILRHPALKNPTVVVVTDRNDLDDQLFGETFATSRPLAPLPEAPQQTTSREDLKARLQARQSGGLIFTTIQKFGLSQADREAGHNFPLLSSRDNVIVMVDEAHRSNYDFIDGFARHLRDALPNASFIGFTGTPIEAADRSTSQVFGEYIDTYDLTQAVEDGATVKVYYEARLARVELPKEIYDELDAGFALATSGTEEEAKERLKSRWATVEAIVGSQSRLKALAEDIVVHWESRRGVLAGKAMVVAMSRRIAVGLYDEIVQLRPEWHSEKDDEGVVKVVITGSAADDEALQPHIRNKSAIRVIKNRAKDAADPLELVIVRDMWLTGFDSPPMHTMYIDKHMHGAPLMQAIARVNRTFKDKPSGLVVDYLGIAEDLKAALADYTKRDRAKEEIGEDLRDKAIPALLDKHEVVSTILHGWDWRRMASSAAPAAYLKAVAGAVDYLLGQHLAPGDAECSEDARCRKCRFIDQSRQLVQLFTVCVPAPETASIRDDVAFFQAVRTAILKIEGPDRIESGSGAELDTAIKQLLAEHMAGNEVIDIYGAAGLARPDLSLIDEGFIEKFSQSDRPNLQIEMLRRLLADEIANVRRRNIVAARHFSEMLAESLGRYQNKMLDAAHVVAELVDLAQHLKAEHDRGAQHNLTTDELAFYDAISTNASAVDFMDDVTLRSIARELVEIVRKDAKTDWQIKEQVRAKVRSTIRRLLLRHGYPPDQEAIATELILAQASLLGGQGSEGSRSMSA